MYPAVLSVQATNDHKLILNFDNSEERVFDMQPILDFGRFTELKDLIEFKKVHIAFDSIQWSNGLDLDPEYLYEKSELCHVGLPTRKYSKPDCNLCVHEDEEK